MESRNEVGRKRARGADDDEEDDHEYDEDNGAVDEHDDGSIMDTEDQRKNFCIAVPPKPLPAGMKEREKKVKIIANWNFKGGVGKTTTSFGLAYAYCAKKNCKVLMVDADPQKNLTQLISRYYTNRYANTPDVNGQIEQALQEGEYGFHHAMSKAFQSNHVDAASLVQIDIEESADLNAKWAPKYRGEVVRDRLFLLPGSFATALLERELISGYEYNADIASAARLGGYPAVFWNLIRKTAAAFGIEYVIVDLSPAFSTLNANIIFSSDVFVVPCAPERFSVEALKSIPSILSNGGYFERHLSWLQRFSVSAEAALNKKLRINHDYLRYPKHTVQFGGVIISRFSYHAIDETNQAFPKDVFHPSSGMTENFIREIHQQSAVLVSAPPAGLPPTITQRVYDLGWTFGDRLELGRFPEAHKLGLLSQNASIPVGYLPNRLMKINS